MKTGKHFGAAGLFLAVCMLMGAGWLLSACNTVAGAGQDVSWFGNAVTGDAVQTERAAPPPPPPY
jgi:predicted small secreted protein